MRFIMRFIINYQTFFKWQIGTFLFMMLGYFIIASIEQTVINLTGQSIIILIERPLEYLIIFVVILTFTLIEIKRMR